MRIRRLSIENFRKFRAPVVLDGFSDGLNLVCEPNESGKSTVLEALRAALFERYNSKSGRIRSFRPHGDDVAPTVTVEFEVASGRWQLAKRFLQGPSVTLDGPEGRFTAEAAEEKLQALLGFNRAGNSGADDDSRGALGLLWVEQGQSFQLGSPAETARRTLEEALASEVGAVTGGRRAKAVQQQVEKALADFYTATGKPTGRLKQAQDAAAASRERASACAQELMQFDEVLKRLETKRNEQRRLVRDIEDPEADKELKALDADIERARRAADALRMADMTCRSATADREALDKRVEIRAGLRAALLKAEAAARAALENLNAHAEQLAQARRADQAAAEALDTARMQLRQAEELQDKAQAARRSAADRQQLAAAFARLDRANGLAAEIARIEARIAGSRMDEAADARLRKLEAAVIATRATLDAGAASLSVTLQPGAAITLDGAPLESGTQISLTRDARIDIPGVGALAFRPPAGSDASLARHRAASDDLAAFLAAVGHADPAAAHAAARARTQDETALAALRSRLEAECPADPALGLPAGLDALRGALAGRDRPEPLALDAPQPPAEIDLRPFRTAEIEAMARRQAALDSLQKAEMRGVELQGASDRAEGDRLRLAQELAADLAPLPDADLEARQAAARADEARALVDRETAGRAAAALDVEALHQQRERMVKKRERLQADLPNLAGEVARLEEQARTLGGEGPGQRAEAAREEAEAAEAAHARLKDEGDALALLLGVLREAQQDAARRYLRPITRRMEPFVRRLLPNASLAFTEDYKPGLLMRGGREEAAELLSKGTQEQLAVLTRIAFADLLIDKGKPASLVLDDALVFSDDDRFEVMTDILADAARRMQVIILSCRASAYRTVDATRLPLG